MISSIALPVRVDFKEWATQIAQDLNDVSYSNPPDVKGWRGWAEQFVNNSRFGFVPTPSEIAFPGDEGWKKWAGYLIESIYNKYK